MNSKETPLQESNKKVMDPRVKEGQGLDYWAEALYEKHQIPKQVYEHFLYVNSHKEEEMEKRHLPQLRHYGVFSDIDSLMQVARAQKPESRFIIRCSNKNGEVRRLIDAGPEEVYEFAKKIEGGFEAWRVELKEFTKTIQAGTLIVNSKGEVRMEAWYGPHYLNSDESCPKFYANFDSGFVPASLTDQINGVTEPKLNLSYKWSAPEGKEDELPDIQERMLTVIKTLVPKIKPEIGQPVYAEYGVRPDSSIYFIEVNDSTLLTDLHLKQN